MTNKPMLSVERELLEDACLPERGLSTHFRALAKLRAILDKPPTGWLPCSPNLLESGVDCATAPRWSSKEWDGHSHWHPAPAAQHQGDPVELQHMAVAEDGKLRWMTGRKMQNCELYAMPDGSAIRSKLYAEQPAPVVTLSKLMQAIHDVEEFPGVTGVQLLELVARLNGVKQ